MTTENHRPDEAVSGRLDARIMHADDHSTSREWMHWSRAVKKVSGTAYSTKSDDAPEPVATEHDDARPELAKMPTRFLFRLFVTGEDPKHEKVARGLRRLLANKCCDWCRLEVIDVREHPELAEQTRVLATPTLVRICPRPTMRVVGELAACTRILAQLGLRPGEWPSRTTSSEPTGADPASDAADLKTREPPRSR